MDEAVKKVEVLAYEPAPGTEPVRAGKEPALLGHHAAAGFAWSMVQTFGSKAASLLGQLILAWILAKKDFGVVALAFTAAGLAGLMQQAGLKQILVQRQSRFQFWANPAFWMSLVLGLATCACVILAGPVAARVFRSPQLIGLMVVLAVAAPIDAASVVHQAAAQAQLRFRLMAGTGLLVNTLTTALSVLFAAIGLGPYAFVLPKPIVSAVQSVIYWQQVKVPIRLDPQVRLWRYMVNDSALMIATALCNCILAQGDYMVLGLFHAQAVVGAYYFAFNLSTQSMQLLTGSLTGVLFPTFSRLESDRVRQTRGCIRASRLLVFAGTPLCLLQAAVAAPLFHLAFKDKWNDAIPVFQVLSIGMAMVLASGSAAALIQAQGRFAFYFVMSTVFSVFFLTFVAIGAKLGGALSVAVGVTVFYTIFGPVGVYMAIRPGGGTWRDLAAVYLRPLIMGAAAAGLAAEVGRAPFLRGHDIAGGLAIAVVATIVYAGLVRIWAWQEAKQVWGLARPMLARFGLAGG